MKLCDYCLEPAKELIENTPICTKCQIVFKNPNYGPRLLRGHIIHSLRGEIPSDQIGRMVDVLERNARKAAIMMQNQKKADP